MQHLMRVNHLANFIIHGREKYAGSFATRESHYIFPHAHLNVARLLSLDDDIIIDNCVALHCIAFVIHAI